MLLTNEEMCRIARERVYALENLLKQPGTREQIKDARDRLIEVVLRIGWDFLGEEPPT